jgi:RHS repeat-associated protein
VVFPHTNWRGQFEVGSKPNGGVCPTSCLAIDWPGAQTNLDGDNPTPADGAAWFGSLITGQRDGSGMTYLRNRYYDPSSGRFTQEDPIGLAGGMNAYGFAGGDRVNFSDPMGLCPEWVDGKPCDLSAAASFAAGFGDMVSFGATNWIRNRMGTNDAVDKEGAAYLGGQIGGIAANLGTGGGIVGAGIDFLVAKNGTAIAVPDGAVGPSATRSPGFQFTGGSGGKGLDSKVSGVRIMDANKNQGRRAVYMNDEGQTVSPSSGRTVSKRDPQAHHKIPPE